ncbi:hypothetical protein AMTR_s00050p00206180 [Amborella trichopoda]|uniref:Uncharacterized protein n=1 Tax=Amborella trichopoda TaxID=13333 RepID=W1PZB5_AMBTC|nr:hypothetical protein AMTR_s00050p00206180 [Amborella trichopoda]
MALIEKSLFSVNLPSNTTPSALSNPSNKRNLRLITACSSSHYRSLEGSLVTSRSSPSVSAPSLDIAGAGVVVVEEIIFHYEWLRDRHGPLVLEASIPPK